MISEKDKKICELEEQIAELDRREWMIKVSANILSWQDREKLDRIKRERRELEEELRESKNG